VTAAPLTARFDLGRLLKQGNGVATYLGHDRRSGQPVIVKTVSTTEDATAARLRLEHEAHVLERLSSSAGFRPLLASGRDDGCFYLVQPLVAGGSLAERLGKGPLDVASALRVATDILGALQVAHDHGVLHRDVKPANVIVEPGEAARGTVLIDFGLARSAGLDPSLQTEPVALRVPGRPPPLHGTLGG